MKQIGTDFQGWPEMAMTLREILINKLGLKISENEDGYHFISGHLNKDILDSYPVILEDDGMGYGINPRYITSVDNEVYRDDKIEDNVFNIFAENISK